MPKFRGKPLLDRRKLLLGLWVGATSIVLILVAGNQFLPKSKPDYIRKQEFYQKNAQTMLDKMLGRDNYLVNIAFQYSEQQRQVSSVLYTPHVITERSQQTTAEQYKEEASEDRSNEGQSNRGVEGKDNQANKLSLQDRPAVNETGKEVVSHKRKELFEKLPGLAPRSNRSHSPELPGFPKINPLDLGSPELGTQINRLTSSDPQSAEQQSSSDKERKLSEQNKTLQHGKGQKTINSGTEQQQNKSTEKSILNENRETILIPDSKIERLYISLVINERRLTELNIHKEDVANTVKLVVGFQEERGDEVYLIAYPFKGFVYWLKKTITKYQHLLYIALGILLFAFGLRWVSTYLNNKLRAQKHRSQREETLSHVKEEESSKSQQVKQEEILDFARKKPAEFAKVLVDWIEKEDNTHRGSDG